MTDPKQRGSELSVTALYTAGVWEWAGVEGATLLAGDDTRATFRWVNRFMALAGFFRRRLPSLRHSLALRHTIIDHLVNREPETLLLEIGVGLSPRTLVAARRGRRTIEVDLPSVMRVRMARLEAGVGPQSDPPVTRPLSLEGDICELEAFTSHIDERATLVVEGLFPYFATPERESLWARLARALGPHGGRLIFDLTPANEQPRAGWVGRALGWMMRRFTRGRGFVAGHESRGEIVEALGSSGFDRVEVFDSGAPPPGCSGGANGVVTQTVVFEAVRDRAP